GRPLLATAMKCLLALVAVCGVIEAAELELPSPAPVVRSVFPGGVQKGTTAEVTLTGQNLQDTLAIEFAGRGVTGVIEAKAKGKLTIRVTAEGAETGRRDYRLTTSRGSYV